MKPSDAPFPAYADWSFAIGHFLLQFGALEHHAGAYLKDHLTTHPAADLKTSTFGKRVEVIEQHFATDHVEKIVAFQLWRERLKPVQQLRNHIAHGHMTFADLATNPT